jgi:hypothetical protein
MASPATVRIVTLFPTGFAHALTGWFDADYRNVCRRDANEDAARHAVSAPNSRCRFHGWMSANPKRATGKVRITPP